MLETVCQQPRPNRLRGYLRISIRKLPQAEHFGELHIDHLISLLQKQTNPCFNSAADFMVAKDTYKDLEAVNRWSACWDLPPNLDKSQLLLAIANQAINKPLCCLSEFTDLGVSFSLHISRFGSVR